MTRLAVQVHHAGNEWRTVTGRKLKDYPLGVTIQCDRGMTWYATKDRVLGEVDDAITFPGVLALPGVTLPCT